MPVWDKFLTDRDREHLKNWGKPDRDELGKKPVLLVIDMYYASVGHERKPLMESIKDWPMSCGEEGWRAIDHMQALIPAARSAGIPVVYVKALPGFPTDPSRVSERGNRGAGTLGQLPAAIQALGNEIVHEIAPATGDLVIGKAAPSAFSGTPLLQYLQMLRADTVIVCGETTSGCVRAAVVDAASYRFRVGIVEECCFDRTEAAHAMNLFDMHQKYGEVISIDSALSYFDQVGTDNRR
ncbi:isochorismatase family protein [Parapusillimonas sp. SGNA-6]|nr:isochorismatase family protein [Parapusillimonas sp. SGNA-6]